MGEKPEFLFSDEKQVSWAVPSDIVIVFYFYFLTCFFYECL